MENKYHILDLKVIKKKFSESTDGISPFDAGIPLLELSDKTIEQIYYFRWHTFCKHIKSTPAGYVITEFLPDVPWAGKYNTISCPAGHHLYEGRWLHNQKYINEYSQFWFTKDGEPRRYSFWAADAVYAVCKVSGDFSLAEILYEKLKENYAEWEKGNLMENGLFYQIDDRDGMEYSIGGSGCRPTINSYMYGDAAAIFKIADMLGFKAEAELYSKKAEALKNNINTMLWDEKAEFYKTLSEEKGYEKADVREETGYVPWYFNIPDENKSCAWRFLNDKNYFYAPYGPTTAEQNHPDFMKEFDHECLWNGPSWPFATSQTLTAMGNLLNGYKQSIIDKSDYFSLLKLYANSQYIKTEIGEKKPFIDEDLDPYTGEWIARNILQSIKPPREDANRGIDYNHSSFCDLVLSGLAGIRAREDNILEINPMFTPDNLEYFCADGILYHGHYITVLWDKTGTHYSMGAGLKIFCNGIKAAECDSPSNIKINLSEVLKNE